jgi:large exoprotein involved in heme utilization and adhesion
VNVSDSGILSTLARGRASGGNLSIQTQKLTVQNQGTIATDTSGTGNAGPLTIDASDSVEVANSGSNVTTQALPDSTGNGGKLAIATGQLTIRDRAAVSSATFGQGLGGDVQLQANSLSLTNRGRITSRSEGSGNAGNIAINVRDTLQSSAGEIVATATQAGGGNINIAADDIRLDNSSLISTSVFDSTGGGGNITINSTIFLALEDSDILANAADGRGGDITIKSPGFLADLFSTGQAEAVGRNPGDFAQFRGNGRVDISADSRSGSSGTVNVPNIEFGRGLGELPSDLVDASEQIDRRCTPSGSARGSSFTVVGRGGLPPNPNDPLIGESIITNWATLDSEPEKRDRTARPTHLSSTHSQQLVEAQGWAIGANGQVILTAQANTATPMSPGVLPLTCPDNQTTKE